jgi:ADP-ribose pyrophosphatase
VRLSRNHVPLPRLRDPRLDGEAASTLAEDGSFLRIERLRMRVGESQPFPYDVVTRDALDAVVLAAHFEEDGVRHVLLRSAVRPPLWRRDRTSPWLWELPAGLVERGELPRDAAVRELFEEVGARALPDDLVLLGPAVYPAPGMVAELQTFFHVAIDRAALATPEGDSSALEQVSVVASLPLDEALALCASGDIQDAKTELGLRRLAAELA